MVNNKRRSYLFFSKKEYSSMLLAGCTVLAILCASATMAEKPLIPLQKAPIDITDPASLQRGAQLYFNYCLGCHNLQYERYNSLAQGIGITDEAGNVLETVVKENLLFTGEKITAPIVSAMRAEDAAKWFGMAPPDLTLVARVRGTDWLYTYLKSFYHDPEKPWGVNNLVFPDVAMPHVLVSLQGVQEPKYAVTHHSDSAAIDSVASAGATASPDDEAETAHNGTEPGQVLVALELAAPGTMAPAEYDAAVIDLVNFLSYVAEPVQLTRRHIGILVMVFLGIFLVFSYLLKREYWKDVK